MTCEWSTRSAFRATCGGLAAGAALAAAAYGAYVTAEWLRYGRATRSATGNGSDALLDRFMPAYDVAERHHVSVAAPAAVTLAVAEQMDLFRMPLVRALFRARALLLGATGADARRPRGLLAEARALGWVVLAERPGREIAVGAVTKPWEPNVTFRSIPPHAFEAFQEPDYVKIAWTLCADPYGAAASVFRTETRAVATDASARAKFRRYWSLLSPGIRLIRTITLRPLKTEAERRARTLALVRTA